MLGNFLSPSNQMHLSTKIEINKKKLLEGKRKRFNVSKMFAYVDTYTPRFHCTLHCRLEIIKFVFVFIIFIKPMLNALCAQMPERERVRERKH